MKLSVDGISGNFPDFLVVGAQKCGTSSLHHYLKCHPGIFLPSKKELTFWHQNRNPNRAIFDIQSAESVPMDLESYLDWFTDAGESQVVGEVCPSYLYYHEFVIQSLKDYHPQWEQVKIVIILRDPLQRIFSGYRFVKHKGLDPEKLDFNSSIREEPRRKSDLRFRCGLHYLSLSLYSHQVKAYLDVFPNVKILLFEDLVKNRNALMLELCEFLGVDQNVAKAIDYSKNTMFPGQPESESFPVLHRCLDLVVVWDDCFRRDGAGLSKICSMRFLPLMKDLIPTSSKT